MKKLIWIIPLGLIILAIIFTLYVKLALPNVGPTSDIKVEITPERLDRGKYLATVVMSCGDCHSQRDMTKYAAPITGIPFSGGGPEFTVETGSPGNFYAPNLTPYHLGDWTDGEIYRAITTGVSKDGRALFPAMPYHLFGQASKEDLYSVIAYIRSLPSTENSVPAPEPNFPFSLIMNFIPQKSENREIPDKNNKIAYGEYMTTIAACYDCHTPQEKGQFIENLAFAGNFEFIIPNGVVRSANITPDKETGIGNWTEETFVNRFKVYSDSSYVIPDVGDGFNTVMPWNQYAKMDNYDLEAIFAYLQTLEPKKNTVIKFSPKE